MLKCSNTQMYRYLFDRNDSTMQAKSQILQWFSTEYYLNYIIHSAQCSCYYYYCYCFYYWGNFYSVVSMAKAKVKDTITTLLDSQKKDGNTASKLGRWTGSVWRWFIQVLEVGVVCLEGVVRQGHSSDSQRQEKQTFSNNSKRMIWGRPKWTLLLQSTQEDMNAWGSWNSVPLKSHYCNHKTG